MLSTLLALFSCGECEHDFSEANCLEAKKCTLCGISEGSPLGHNFSDATCTAPRTCTECGAVEGEPIAHSFGMWTVKIAATCTSDGVRERVCECGEKESAVTVSAFSGSAADEFCEDGVTVNICKVFRLLMIGNSLSLDAADCTSAGSSSVLYDIIKAMLGENSRVEIGILYSGAKTAAWHATVAERESCEYQFYFISDETDGLWSIVSTNASTALGLGYADWDYVTIQPYGSEVLNGVDDTTTGSTDKAAKFLPLSVSLPYLIDCVADKAPDAKIYYYLTWSNVTSTGMLNLGSTAYEGMRSVAITALGHVGEGGKGFSGLIPVGTAIQNATQLSEAIKATVMQHAKAGVKVSVTLGEAVSPSTTPTRFSATVNISYGYTAQSVSVNGTVKLP